MMEKTETTVLSVDYSRAVRLDTHIKTHADLVQKSLYEVCKGLKEMRDEKLYKELGYRNFEEYCTQSVGIKRRQAYNYITIAENLSERFLCSRLHKMELRSSPFLQSWMSLSGKK